MKNRPKFGYFNPNREAFTEDPQPFLVHKVALVVQADGRITIRCRHDKCRFRVEDVEDVAKAEKLAREHLAEPIDPDMRERRGLVHRRRGMWFN